MKISNKLNFTSHLNNIDKVCLSTPNFESRLKRQIKSQ